MNNEWLKITGKLVFDIKDQTTKHRSQSTWKKSAIVLFEDDMCEYYGWFLKKRFNITLNIPIRGSHYTVINDKYSNEELWNKVKSEHQGDSVDVYYNPSFRSNIEHWWLKAYSIDGNLIRKKLGLGLPFFNPHITIGLVNNKNKLASEFALNTEKFFKNDVALDIPEDAFKYL